MKKLLAVSICLLALAVGWRISRAQSAPQFALPSTVDVEFATNGVVTSTFRRFTYGDGRSYETQQHRKPDGAVTLNLKTWIDPQHGQLRTHDGSAVLDFLGYPATTYSRSGLNADWPGLPFKVTCGERTVAGAWQKNCFSPHLGLQVSSEGKQPSGGTVGLRVVNVVLGAPAVAYQLPDLPVSYDRLNQKIAQLRERGDYSLATQLEADIAKSRAQ